MVNLFTLLILIILTYLIIFIINQQFILILFTHSYFIFIPRCNYTKSINVISWRILFTYIIVVQSVIIRMRCTTLWILVFLFILVIFSIFIKFRSQFVIVYMVIIVIRMHLRLLIVLIIIWWNILTCFFNLIICKRRLKFIIISMIYQMFLIRFTQFLIVSFDLNYIIFFILFNI